MQQNPQFPQSPQRQPVVHGYVWVEGVWSNVANNVNIFDLPTMYLRTTAILWVNSGWCLHTDIPNIQLLPPPQGVAENIAGALLQAGDKTASNRGRLRGNAERTWPHKEKEYVFHCSLCQFMEDYQIYDLYGVLQMLY